MTRRISRRGALAGIGLAVGSAGCAGRARNIAGREGSSQLVLEIRTTPADEDPNGIRIARALAENLDAVGIDARVETMNGTDLHRTVLLNHDFDVYVGQYTEVLPFDPDVLYGLTHSRFTAEAGWQNPFGFTDLDVDELLEKQRAAGGPDRSEVVSELQRSVCEKQPFTVVAFPDALAAARTDRFVGWETGPPISASGLLGMDYVDEGTEDDGEPVTLRLATTDGRISVNRNPIAAEYRRYGTFMSMLYDRLAIADDGTSVPWLARGWEWLGPETLELELRESTWHDGEPLTAADVAFTYAFLRDTSMGNAETPVPAPQFRGRGSIVESALPVDDSTVRLVVDETDEAVAERALQVPILPKHVWSERAEPATVGGFEFDIETTEALVTANEKPVGSGPVRFVESTPGERVVFERNPDHFLARDGSADAESVDDGVSAEDAGSDGDRTDSTAETGGGRSLPERFLGKPAFDRLEVAVVGSDVEAVQWVADGYADGTASNLGPDSVPRIGRESDTRLVSTRSAAFYYVGYNARRAPLSNPRFRGIVASLLDKATVVDDAFAGYARPASSPLAASTEWVPDDLEWDADRDADPVHPFRGEDGSVDVAEAREALREIGYRFDESDRLLARDQ
ncbi:peptide/nickel transport system substrate-binding protein [Halorubrum aquaticum]|uniref:Peptide/nickel transport system substrate-binding protein n=1 Tax=Halorubrum aquaticum TaxID=387340 RepID=A0A1I3CG94_9EURY|nr:ABC transporter substrate-binding protein [Halorubrum aquaticum]SFH73542.1 peptide/nickel transport system substrate-binding protein [Halorubrum aquaticum]